MFNAKTPMAKMLVAVSIFFGIIFGWYGIKKIFIGIMMARYQPPAVVITSTKAKKENWQSYITAVGTVSAINGVDLASDSAGIVKEIRFNSGQMVKAGDVIILLDTSVEEAELKSNQATLQLAQMNFNRDKTLFGKNVSSKASYDQGVEALQAAEANVDATLAKIKQKTITAPFDGRLGIREINLGEYVSPGQGMVTLQSLNPLYVNFSVPEQYLSNLYINQPVEINVNVGSGKMVKGLITAINSKVDQTTRNVLIQATIPNDRFQLYPGMFASCRVLLPSKPNIIVIPQTAIAYSLSGDYVFVIKDNQAYKQYIKVGERRDDQAAILEGLNDGTPIITSGQLKLQNGTRVKVDNSVEL